MGVPMTLGGGLRAAGPFNVVGKGAHGLLSDFYAFATIDGGSCGVDGDENPGAPTFVLNPKRHRCLHGILGALNPTALFGLADKILLLGSEVYLPARKAAGRNRPI